MSDLSLRLQQAASQLPVSSYFDEALFRRERELLFERGPRYVGHALSVPEPGDYHALPQEGQGRALVRNPQGRVELVSNVCRHRQAIMLNGRGSAGPTAPAASCWGHRTSRTTPALTCATTRCANGTAFCSRTTATTWRPIWQAWGHAPS